jgi:hypothetical protein
MIFTHTLSERDMWRGWLPNGQSLELSRARSGWELGAGILIHQNDADDGDRMLCLKFWRFSAYIPLGVVSGPFQCGDEPQWSVFGCSEFRLSFRWGGRSRYHDWPGTIFTVAYEQQMLDGSWRDVFDRTDKPYSETHPYTYVLRSGEVQNRKATITKRRHVLNRRWLKRFGWPNTIRESINIKFDGEVGECTGSWKGGTIGCSYDLRAGEVILEALRRMEGEKKF